jgi:hypothetical protein
VPASVPAPIAKEATTPAAPVCPTCSVPADPSELADLGKCLACDYKRAGQVPPRCPCGAVATADTANGPRCDACVHRAQAESLMRGVEQRTRRRHAPAVAVA